MMEEPAATIYGRTSSTLKTEAASFTDKLVHGVTFQKRVNFTVTAV
jgi:hypothetical protein